MRTLVLLRGLPGCGKSTWVEENGLEMYTVSSDRIRSLCWSPELRTDGSFSLASKDEPMVWSIVTSVVESRMTNGDLTVIDATNITRKEINRWLSLAKKYRYRVYCVDFSKISLEEVKRRNSQRDEIKRVPYAVIDKFHARLQDKDNAVPGGITVLDPDAHRLQFELSPMDLDSYKKVHCIGDIHGCFTVLNEYLKDGLKNDEFYIFLGDYIDRGIENAKTLDFLMSVMDKENVILLEGNHERWLDMWSRQKTAYSPEFEKNTRKELERAGISTRNVRRFYRKLAQCAYFRHSGITYFACHGGISSIGKNPVYISAHQMIHGVGDYDQTGSVEKNFERNTPADLFQIHGHRNYSSPVHSSERNYNLEGGVENGGSLRAVEISKDGVKEIEIENTVYKKSDFSFVHTALQALRDDPLIKEKIFGNISSFNFTRDAFYGKKWNERTQKARGLYINTKTEEIVARGYDKFFNVGEMPGTEIEDLARKFSYPVRAYVKENGFLGLVSWNREIDDFFISTKSDPTGIFAEWFKEEFYKTVPEDTRARLKNFFRENNVTLLFECVDWVHDPHIIDYPESKMYLLDIVDNSFEFKKYPYKKLKSFAKDYSFEVKTLAFEFYDRETLEDWYGNIHSEGDKYLYKGNHIEGFVLEDASGFMVKMKLAYYLKWKRLRGLVGRIDKINTESLNNEEKDFILFVKKQFETGTVKKGDPGSNICNLRRLYEESERTHHCNTCPYCHVEEKGTFCRKYNKQLYYLYSSENRTPYVCRDCKENYTYVPYIDSEYTIKEA